MNRPGLTRLAQLVAGAILALAGGAFAPSAHASCGSGHGSGVFRMPSEPDVLPPVKRPAPCAGEGCDRAERPADPPKAPPPRRCSGPTCSASQLPPPVPPSHKLPAPDDRDRLASAADQADSPPAVWLAPEDERAVKPLATSIFHPPR